IKDKGYARHYQHIEKEFLSLAPLPIQRAIVSKIETLFSDLDNGIANLKKAQEQLKIYRQAVLKKAFEGELTKEWREKQSNLPTAEELLKQIKEERQNHYNQQIEDWKKAVKEWEKNGKEGKKPTKPKAIKELPPLTEDELNELPRLPEGWTYIKQGELIEEPKYGTSKKCNYVNKGNGVLRIPNIIDLKINSLDLKYAEFSIEEKNIYKLQKNDILTIRSNGSVSIVGKCALIRDIDTNFLFAGYLIRLRPFQKNISSKYLINCLSSIKLRNQIEAKAKSTSGVNNINSGELSSLIIPVCSIPEQHQIVQEIESRLSVCDKVEQSITESLEKAKALRQSILKKAFEGRLLSEAEVRACKQEEDYEPASVLLEKIKAEKLTKEQEAKKAKKKSKK
ncbi:MAG: restriction endonuclease subunit S, partial [Bacteroidota bacterium]|nr:restriction endonuclease subunit S [Bacteroidota bacterium]